MRGDRDGAGLCIGVAVSRFNEHITRRLLAGALSALHKSGVAEESVDVVWVPGAYDLPIAAQALARSGRYDALVCLGCVIRGETTHYDHICAESARGLQDLAVRDGLAIGYGILTVENEAQALARASAESRDNGGEAVRACLALVDLKRRLAGEENDHKDRAAVRR